MQHFVYALYVVAKTNVHGTDKSGSVAIFMPFSLAHFIEKSWFTTPRTLEIKTSLFCRCRWWHLHCNSEFLHFVPFSYYFSFFTAYKRTSIQQKKSESQPASLSSGNTSSPLLWKWFLDWNCCYLQTCLAPDFSRSVSASLPLRSGKHLPSASAEWWLLVESTWESPSPSKGVSQKFMVFF